MSTDAVAVDQSRTALLARVRERLAVSPDDLTPEAMAQAIRAESGGVLGDIDLLEALRYLHTELVGAGCLEELLADPDCADILVVGPRQVWVDCGKGLQRTAITFDDDAAVRRLAVRLALAAGRRLDDAQPWVDGQLTDVGRRGVTVRLHAIIAPLATDGTCLSLRVLRPASQDLAGLMRSGAIPEAVAPLVRSIIDARLAFLVVGGTGAGKTTLLSALLGDVAPAERIICIEDAAELAPQHPHVVHLVARNANVEGVGEVSVRTLLRQALRMRPDRIVIGEVRGAEVVDLLAALNTGHDGGAGTLHANSTAEVPARMEALAALGGLSREALHAQLGAAISVVLGVRRDRHGTRRLAEVAVVRRSGDGWVRTEPAWRLGSGFTAAADELTALIEERRR